MKKTTTVGTGIFAAIILAAIAGCNKQQTPQPDQQATQLSGPAAAPAAPDTQKTAP